MRKRKVVTDVQIEEATKKLKHFIHKLEKNIKNPTLQDLLSTLSWKIDKEFQGKKFSTILGRSQYDPTTHTVVLHPTAVTMETVVYNLMHAYQAYQMSVKNQIPIFSAEEGMLKDLQRVRFYVPHGHDGKEWFSILSVYGCCHPIRSIILGSMFTPDNPLSILQEYRNLIQGKEKVAKELKGIVPGEGPYLVPVEKFSFVSLPPLGSLKEELSDWGYY
ncbi:MAG: hypothetical protein GXN92_02370 [Candidatus Micrarchaeota archaeon]|nr:hypothetical protein [Candidatus Micrarchaeota archaeon]